MEVLNIMLTFITLEIDNTHHANDDTPQENGEGGGDPGKSISSCRTWLDALGVKGFLVWDAASSHRRFWHAILGSVPLTEYNNNNDNS